MTTGTTTRGHINSKRDILSTSLEPGSTPAEPQWTHRPPEAATPAAPDPVKELERLEGMRDRGILSREEFDQEKRKLLGAQSYRRI